MTHTLTPAERRITGNMPLAKLQFEKNKIKRQMKTEILTEAVTIQAQGIQAEQEAEINAKKQKYNQEVLMYNAQQREEEERQRLFYVLQQKEKEKKEKEMNLKNLARKQVNIKKQFSLGKMTLATVTGFSTFGFLFS